MPENWGRGNRGRRRRPPSLRDLRPLRPFAGWSGEDISYLQQLSNPNTNPDFQENVRIAQLLDQPYEIVETARAAGMLDDLIRGGSDGGGGARGPTAEELALEYAKLGLDERQINALIEHQKTQDYLEALGLQSSNQLGQGQLELGQGQLSLDQLQVAGQLKLGQAEETRLGKELEELLRANRAREAEDSKRRALEAAQAAISGYLKASELADARRLASLQERRALLPLMVDPNQQYVSGMGPTDPLAQVTQGFGLNFNPTLQGKTTVNTNLPQSPAEIEALRQLGLLQGAQ